MPRLTYTPRPRATGAFGSYNRSSAAAVTPNFLGKRSRRDDDNEEGEMPQAKKVVLADDMYQSYKLLLEERDQTIRQLEEQLEELQEEIQVNRQYMVDVASEKTYTDQCLESARKDAKQLLYNLESSQAKVQALSNALANERRLGKRSNAGSIFCNAISNRHSRNSNRRNVNSKCREATRLH